MLRSLLKNLLIKKAGRVLIQFLDSLNKVFAVQYK
jgi:hypothetical protein